MASPSWVLNRWLLRGEWAAHPLRALMAIAAIALGVAMGFAIHLINAAAFNEFSAAVRSLSGQSDLQVRAASGFIDENRYPQLAQHEGVTVASPVLELDAVVPGQSNALRLLGIDIFRAALVAPDLLPSAGEDKPFDALADDAIFLSPAAMAWLNVKTGDRLALRSGTDTVDLRVAGGIASARPGQRLAVMDVGAAQWRFKRLGQLSRIDLKLAEGVNRERFRQELARELGTGLLVTESQEQQERSANMSRAYRVNLNVLALVALFTGAFLVFSTQALSVLRRRSQLALLRVLGLSRRRVLLQILLEGGLLGVAGAVLGLALGYALAALALRFFGGDLGGGFFPGIRPSVQFAPVAALVFLLLGIGVALLGCASPAWEAARARPAAALKAGSEDVALSRLAKPWPALILLLLGAVLSQLPPVAGLPIFGYLAVALLLIGGIGLMPRLAALMFGALSRRGSDRVVPALSLARLANAPNQASIALGGILSSFSLMVAMAIMVDSFRVSVDEWLGQVLSADVYVRASSGGATTGALGPVQQQALAATPGVRRIEFLKAQQLTLAAGQAPVALIARPIDPGDPGRTLPLLGKGTPPILPAGAVPVWISEAMVDLYGYAAGREVSLPFGPAGTRFLVAGIWRDYARQGGAIQMRLEDYRHLSGDTDVNDAGIWLAPGASAESVIARIRGLPFGPALEISQPGEIRAVSLRIFDRSFAITYLLEAVAIVIGLFGVAATFSAQTLARAREFGMLRHVGVTRRQILGMLAAEGGMLALLGILTGFALGGCISLILVYIVNPQSFHWTMELHVPWGSLMAVAAALLLSAGLTALLAGRQAVAGSAVRAVREDW
ncbi:ABC transporter permease [Noviherbaspirillum humi]